MRHIKKNSLQNKTSHFSSFANYAKAMRVLNSRFKVVKRFAYIRVGCNFKGRTLNFETKTMECSNCSTPLPDKGYFCPNCSKQFKCKDCGELLLKDAKACIYCGEEVGVKSSATNMNTIEFSETKNTRNFKANFTDTVGQSISDSFGIILSNKLVPRKPNTLPISGGFLKSPDANNTEEAEVVEEMNDNPELRQLKMIFKTDGEKITLSETRLKANSKRDYGIRLSIIFLYYKHLLGIDNVPRKDLTSILQNASVEDSNLRKWIANNPYIGVNNDLVEIKAAGIDSAKKYLLEIKNTESKDNWQIGTQSKAGRKPKDKKEKK